MHVLDGLVLLDRLEWYLQEEATEEEAISKVGGLSKVEGHSSNKDSQYTSNVAIANRSLVHRLGVRSANVRSVA
jgi:hypothetical protein